MKRNDGVVSVAAVEPLLRMAGAWRSMGAQRAMRSSLGDLRDEFEPQTSRHAPVEG